MWGMKKKWIRILVMVIVINLIVPMAVQVTHAYACSMGLTPGFWKNHTEIWDGDWGDDYYNEIFGLPESFNGIRLHISLLDALTAKGNKNGVNAFLRHSAAGWLNAVYLTNYFEEDDVIAIAQAAFGITPSLPVTWRGVAIGDMEGWKNYLEDANEIENAVFK
jgi:hypothetical protein